MPSLALADGCFINDKGGISVCRSTTNRFGRSRGATGWRYAWTRVCVGLVGMPRIGNEWRSRPFGKYLPAGDYLHKAPELDDRGEAGRERCRWLSVILLGRFLRRNQGRAAEGEGRANNREREHSARACNNYHLGARLGSATP